MKKLFLIFVFLLLVVPVSAEMNGYMAGVVRAAGGSAWTPPFTYDLWLDFESNSDCTAAEITKSDHCATGTWDVTDASSELACQDGAAKYNGTYGMSYDFTGGNIAHLKFTSASGVSSASIGFWYYAETLTTWDDVNMFSIEADNGVLIRGYHSRDAGDPYMEIIGASNSDDITITAGAWYWVTAKAVDNSTSSLAVYNTSGAQVGATVTCTAGDKNNITLYYVASRTAPTANSFSGYWDDFCIDWTDATFPLEFE